MNLALRVPSRPIVDCRESNILLIPITGDKFALRQFTWKVGNRLNGDKPWVGMQRNSTKRPDRDGSFPDIRDSEHDQSHPSIPGITDHFHIPPYGKPHPDSVTQVLPENRNRGQHRTVDGDDRSGTGR